MEQAVPQTFDRVLSSMCTRPHPVARAAAERFLATNPGDPETYRAVADLETEVVETLGELTGLDQPRGYVASGGTEANIQAVRAARNRASTDDPNVVAPSSVHFSFQKAAEVLGVDLRIAPVGSDRRADPEAMASLVDDDTALVVGVAGTTEYGRVDPIPELADLAAEADALCHVDAAWGGFALPFTDHEWHFGHAAVDTMTIDPHKMGQAVVPAGGLLARDAATMDALAVETPYLESTSQATLTGTRSGAGVASAAAALDELWPDGYRENYERAQANAEWVADALADRGFDVVDPVLPLVAVDLPDSLFAAVQDRDWRLARTARGELRLVCMPHVTRDTLSAFLRDLDACRDEI
ncbi:tyrosine decarboxylase / aspartate 1-decarboxylase [Haloplanus vescus]|uniref:Probable L-aspartate decarboxylase n=1 Tax=Haloplanus vescus TaxID=555874 RepID=A0A1H3WVB1_9EURY|nr:tyrosine decarboxylase MfnA [Haloplanus vescus]SDZ90910.1 tyrosine decarboxylase / aspartate 1-decarboxylase [Haloplanus vescus]